jgi:ZIP family zinc transporter
MVYEVLWQSMLAGLATVLGALIVLALGRPGERLLAALLGFAGGVMTAVIIFDLIPSALIYGNIPTALTGFMLGLIFMLGLDILISLFPSLKYADSSGQKGRFLKMGYLIAVGIALHDLPEGVAIAVGYSAKESLGILIALAIGLHNVPEGMATAAPLSMGDMKKWKIIIICLIISIFTPLGAYLGLLLVNITTHFICLLLALAGGAMAFIVRNELIPESHRRHPNFARLGFIFGLLIIFSLGIIHH